MDFIQILAAAIVLGSTIGTTVASLFAYRQKSLVTMLRESNADYKNRVDQLVSDGELKDKQIADLTTDVAQLKREKMLPLDNLTKLVIRQNAETNKSIMNLTKAIQQQGKN